MLFNSPEWRIFCFMAKTKSDKKELVSTYKDLIDKSKSIIIVRTDRVTPNEVNAFRKSIYSSDSKFHVVKNNLFKIALKEKEYDIFESLDFGGHAVLFTAEDIVTPSKELKKLIETTKVEDKPKVTIVGGYLDGVKLTVEQAIDIAGTPTIEESISMILGILDQAMSGVVNVLEDAPRSFVTIIDQAFKEE